MEFTDGQNLGTSYEPEVAIWCNENNAYIEQVGEEFFIRFNPQPTFEEIKQAKFSELITKAKEFEEPVNNDMYFISSVTVIENDVEKNLIVNGDRRTRSNIQDLITYQPTDTVTYRDYENIERQLTKEQLQVMLKELCVNGQLLYEQKWAFEDKINACTTIEELNAIEIKFTMHDFSKEKVVADE